MMSGSRPKLFDDDADDLNLGRFAPKSALQSDPRPRGPANLGSRRLPSRAPKAQPSSRYKTGRTVMLNARVTQRAHDRFHEIIDTELERYQRGEITHRVTLGEVVERALAALEREMAGRAGSPRQKGRDVEFGSGPLHPSRATPSWRLIAVAARNRNVADAQSRAVSDADYLRLSGASDARCLRMSARSVRRTRDRALRRKMRETERRAG